MKFSKKSIKLFVICAVVLIAAIAIPVFLQSRFNIVPQLVASTTASKERVAFPDIDATGLSADQRTLLEILKREYEANPSGTKYSEGVEQAWCANFVSWVYREAGKPLANPHSGSWRIPGTYTLREYYESIDALELADSGYEPKIGDIMLYDNPSPFGQHVNIVIKNDDGVVTTIGGNEPGGIRIFEHDRIEANGFIGYGRLQ